MPDFVVSTAFKAKDYVTSAFGNMGNAAVHSEPTPWMNLPHSINMTLPPLAAVILKL